MGKIKQFNGSAEGVNAWVAEIRPESLSRTAILRLDEGIEGAWTTCGKSLWLRGRQLQQSIFPLPFLELYRVEEDDPNRLFPFDSALPARRLPPGLDWRPVAEFIVPRSTLPLFPPEGFEAKVSLVLERSTEEELPTLLQASRSDWFRWVEYAPQIRLERLSFAASESHVLVRGEPLPPVRGRGWVEREGVAIPVGYRVAPRVERSVLARVLHLAAGEIALLNADGTVEKISTENFIPARRQNVRLTMP